MIRPRARVAENLARDYGCRIGGFRGALRDFIEDYIAENYEEAEDIDYIFGEWFGDLAAVPAAFRIDIGGRGHIHIWEIEASARLPIHKFRVYGRIADGDGPLCTLHILDRYGRETATLDNDLLAPFAYSEGFGELEESLLALARGEIRPPTPSAPTPPSLLTKGANERAILRAVYELGLIKPGETL